MDLLNRLLLGCKPIKGNTKYANHYIIWAFIYCMVSCISTQLCNATFYTELFNTINILPVQHVYVYIYTYIRTTVETYGGERGNGDH